MGNVSFKPGNMLYPLPAVLVSVTDGQGNDNVFTVAWTGTICSDPPMVSISVRPSRYSYQMIKDTKEFVINLTTAELIRAADICGVHSGRDKDKFKLCGLTSEQSETVSAPSIAESPVNLECKVFDRISLGSHDMFLADITAVRVDESLIDEKGRLALERCKLAAYAHGNYYELFKPVASLGFAVKKHKKGSSNKGSSGQK